MLRELGRPSSTSSSTFRCPTGSSCSTRLLKRAAEEDRSTTRPRRSTRRLELYRARDRAARRVVPRRARQRRRHPRRPRDRTTSSHEIQPRHSSRCGESMIIRKSAAARSSRWSAPASSSTRRSQLSREHVAPGVTTQELDRARRGVHPLATAACRRSRATRATRRRSASSPNSMVVHGIPGAVHAARRATCSRSTSASRSTASSATSRVHVAGRRDLGRGAAAARRRARRRSRPGSSRRSPATTSRDIGHADPGDDRGRRLLGRPQPRRPRGRALRCTRTRRSRTSASPATARSSARDDARDRADDQRRRARRSYLHDDEWSISTESTSALAPTSSTRSRSPRTGRKS